MNGVSLFAGIGGFDLAMERSGVSLTTTAEIDNNCNYVLSKHFPHVPRAFDVKEITGDLILEAGFEPAHGIITAGWPCQGNSVAGKRQGLADPRSGLWREVARILGELRPRWFIGENVPGLLTVRGGADFFEVIKSLDELGYGVAWRVLDAQNFGVPQRRRRVLIVGCLGDPAGAAKVLLEPESSTGDSPESSEASSSSAGAAVVSTLQGGGRRGYRVDAESAAGGHLIYNPYRTMICKGEYVEGFKPDTIHDALTANPPPKGPPLVAQCVTGTVTHALTSEGADASEDGTGRGTPIAYALSSHHSRNDCEQTQVCSQGVRRLTPLECERLQGFPDGWTAGQSDSARYRQLGNAVAVPVIEWLMRRVVAHG